jgi:hypothetical protein
VVSYSNMTHVGIPLAGNDLVLAFALVGYVDRVHA